MSLGRIPTNLLRKSFLRGFSTLSDSIPRLYPPHRPFRNWHRILYNQKSDYGSSCSKDKIPCNAYKKIIEKRRKEKEQQMASTRKKKDEDKLKSLEDACIKEQVELWQEESRSFTKEERRVLKELMHCISKGIKKACKSSAQRKLSHDQKLEEQCTLLAKGVQIRKLLRLCEKRKKGQLKVVQRGESRMRKGQKRTQHQGSKQTSCDPNKTGSKSVVNITPHHTNMQKAIPSTGTSQQNKKSAKEKNPYIIELEKCIEKEWQDVCKARTTLSKEERKRLASAYNCLAAQFRVMCKKKVLEKMCNESGGFPQMKSKMKACKIDSKLMLEVQKQKNKFKKKMQSVDCKEAKLLNNEVSTVKINCLERMCRELDLMKNCDEQALKKLCQDTKHSRAEHDLKRKCQQKQIQELQVIKQKCDAEKRKKEQEMLVRKMKRDEELRKWCEQKALKQLHQKKALQQKCKEKMFREKCEEHRILKEKEEAIREEQAKESQRKQREATIKRKKRQEVLKKKQKEEELKRKQEEEALRKKCNELAFKQKEETLKKKSNEEATKKRAREMAVRVRAADEANKKQPEEEARKKKAEKEALKKKAEEEAIKKKNEEAALKKKAEAEKKKKEEEIRRKKAEEEVLRKKAEEEAIRKKCLEQVMKKKNEALKKDAEEEAQRKKAEEEAQRKKAEEEAKAKKAQVDALKKKCEAEARKKKSDEIALKKKQESQKKKAEEETKRKQREEALNKEKERQVSKQRQETPKKKAEEEALRKKSEEVALRRRCEEEALRKQCEEVRKTDMKEMALKKKQEELKKNWEEVICKRKEEAVKKKIEQEKVRKEKAVKNKQNKEQRIKKWEEIAMKKKKEAENIKKISEDEELIKECEEKERQKLFQKNFEENNKKFRCSLFKTLQKQEFQDGSKVSIVGAGAAGMACAITLLAKGVTKNISLYDTKQDLWDSERLDLMHGSLFLDSLQIDNGTSIECTKNSRVVVVTAGARPQENQSRLDVDQKTAKILKEIMPELVKQSPKAVFLIVANPSDAMTWYARKLTNLPYERCFSTGCHLDTARFRMLIAQILKVSTQSVQGYIIGEHGDSSVPLWSTVSVGGIPLHTLLPDIGTDRDPMYWSKVHKEVVQAAKKLIRGKGYTNWALGLTVTDIISAIFEDSNRIMSLSTNAAGMCDIEDEIFLSLPCIVNRWGLRGVIHPQLSPWELRMIKKSANILLASQCNVPL